MVRLAPAHPGLLRARTRASISRDRLRIVWRRAIPFGLLLAFTAAAGAGPARWDRKAVERIADRWFEARPKTRFETWDGTKRRALLAEAEAFGPLPEGALDDVRDVCFKAARRQWPRAPKHEIETPYGTAAWDESGRGGPRSGLILGLHGGGEGQGDKGEAKGTWTMKGCLGVYPQGIRLVDDTWNTVQGEAFCLTLVERAKVVDEIDPDRVYVAGFSMGGTGSMYLACRHPDLFAGAIPAHGVIMASPKIKVKRAEEVGQIQYGLLPNLRNLAVYFYTGSDDDHCEPGTFLYAWNAIQGYRKDDPEGYGEIRFQEFPGVRHTYPPGEPHAGIEWISKQRRNPLPEKLVWEYATDPFPLPDAEDPIARPQKQWFYWLRSVRPADATFVTARRAGNEIDVDVSSGAPEDFVVYLNPKMIDVEKDVVVRANGKEVYRGRPVPDLATVLESLDAKLDRSLVFDRKVPLGEPLR